MEDHIELVPTLVINELTDSRKPTRRSHMFTNRNMHLIYFRNLFVFLR